MIALLLLADSVPATPPPEKAMRVPSGDGFVYPGDPGSDGIRQYDSDFAKLLASLPPPPSARPTQLQALAWMTGCWRTELRDYELQQRGRALVRIVGRGSTQISFADDRGWLQVASHLPHRSMFHFIGYDRRANRLILQKVANAGSSPLGAGRSTGFIGARMTFDPWVHELYGMQLTDRISFVRSGTDALRIVVEGQMPSGRFVAVDDLMLRRDADSAACSPPKSE